MKDQMTLFFRHMTYRISPLLLASTSADLSDWIDYLAVVALLTFHWQAGAWELSWFAVALAAPRFFVGPLAGTLVDRLPLKWVFLGTNLGRALFSAAMIFAPSPTALLVLVALRTSVGSAFNPARQAVIPLLVEPDHLTAVNSALFAIRQLTRVLGPALGGALLLILSSQSIFALTAMLSILAAISLVFLKIPNPEQELRPSETVLASFKAGFTELARRPLLILATVYLSATMFATFLYDSFAVLYLKSLGQPASFLGVVMATLGAGGIVGAFLVGRYKLTSRTAFLIMTTSGAATGILIMVAGALPYFTQSVSGVFLAMLFFVIGIFTSFAIIPYPTIVQLETAKDKIGRVTALSDALVTTTMVSAPFFGSVLISSFSIGAPFLASGAITLVIAAITWILALRLSKPISNT